MLDALLRQYWRSLVAYATRLLRDDAAAEEVVQRAFVRLWERDHQLPGGEEVRPFLYHMVRNLAANEWRRAASQSRWMEAVQREGAPVNAPGADTLYETEELAAKIEAAIETLPERRREVFVLSRYHGLTNAQIAEVLGISPQTVANQLVSALRTLRECLRESAERPQGPHLRIVRDRLG